MEVEKKFNKIVFIGSYCDDLYLDKLLKKNLYNQFAANRVQGYYINGLSQIYKEKIDVLSALVTVPYSISKQKKIKRNTFNSTRMVINNVGFYNYDYANVFFQSRSLVKEAKKWAVQNKNSDVLIVVYSMRLSFLNAANAITKIIKNATVINIVPDLPIYMHTNESKFRKIITIFNQKCLISKQKIIDGFVLYAKGMKNELDIGERKWIVIEGFFDANNVTHNISKNKLNNIILYAGTIEKKYGIEMLIDGFLKANLSKVELILYGTGSYVEEVKSISSKFPNVIYGGVLSPNEAYNKMLNADLLVNPRKSSEEYTRFSCPSKTLEYMTTGVPVMMCKLEGVPEEYYEHLFLVEDETPEGFAKLFIEYFNIDVSIRENKGAQAKKFILTEKNSQKQMLRFSKFVNKLFEEDRRRTK